MKRPFLHSLKGARWVCRGDKAVGRLGLEDSRITRLCSNLRIGPLLGAVLCTRGLHDSTDAEAFLCADSDGLHDPMLLPDMALAVDMISEALDGGEHILIHGDYDVDGVAASALLQRALTALGGKVDTYLPHRLTEGYGLSKAAIDKAADNGASLLITVDCGTGATEEIAYAHSRGLRVVITDHHHCYSAKRRFAAKHEPSKDQPMINGTASPERAAVPEVNPQRADSQYPFADLSGVGVAFKLVEALAARKRVPPRAHWRFLDLVALGTIADVSPLVGENRILVKTGLDLIGSSNKVGIHALMKAAGLSPPISSRQVAFVLAPRLNAAGRLAHSEEALRLLTTQDEAEAESLAAALCQHNRARQEEESRTLQEALEMIDEEGSQNDEALLLAKAGWHPGVIGIVASRLVDLFHRPVLLVALPAAGSEKKSGVGSARTISGFPLWDALHHCRHLLLRYGGHEKAAGFAVLPEKVQILRESLCELAREWLSDEDLQPSLEVDILAKAANLTLSAVEELSRLEPFGAANPSPTITAQDLKVTGISRVGENGSHLRLQLHEQGGPILRAIWFGQGGLAEKLKTGQNVDVCLNPGIGTWNGAQTVDSRLQDVAVPEPASRRQAGMKHD